MNDLHDFREMDNNTLQAAARELHGALYIRINTLQRDLNIARETNKKQKAHIQELETENRDLSRMQLPTQVNSQTQIPTPIMHALRMGGMPERFNTIESITDWIKLIVHL